MALDTLDLSVFIALAVAVLAYLAKQKLFPTKDDSGFLPASSNSGRNLLETIKRNGKNTLVFYGSQTGTAEDYASKLSKELSSRFGLKSMTVDFSDYDFDNFGDIPNDILCFYLVATYGEGEPTDNANEFVEWLENEADNLSSLKYTVFGLGNSTYEFYNSMGRKLNEKFEELGAERFATYGEGDDGKGTLDEDFLTWKESVFDTLKNELDFEEKELTYEPGLKLEESDFLTIDDSEVSLGEPNKSYITGTKDLSKGPFDHSHPYLAQITKSRELFTSNDRSCVHIEFDISNSNLRYSTGDHLAVWPSNSNENIETFIKAFGLESKNDTVFQLKKLDPTIAIPFPTPITYGAVIRHHLEISGPVSRQFLSAIASFAPDDASKQRANKIGNDKAIFAQEITQNLFNIADTLLYVSQGKPWTKVPFEYLIENVAHLQPRYYSISSSSLSEKTTINVTAVIETEKKDNRWVTGVVTNLLKNIEIVQNKSSDKPVVTYDLKGPRGKFSNFKLPVHVRRSTFKLPSNPNIPVILVGPGTGVAPLRGFIRDRIQQKKNGSTIGETLLFYGCRNENEDFLYKEEWPEYAKELGESFEIFTAFSRHDPNKKVYVQHKILEQKDKINKLLESGAFIYVCGDASHMARDVQASFSKILAEGRGISEEKAGELVRSFKVQNRYQEDVW
ncbi:FAD binding domain-containing protein [Scheffersomyces amazonensis]|uniref:FAD binding domain-containing protein n=1 Tax=Scheffersomyces amazonensis TaxID=1078765 RepID=UPI00315C5137